MAKSILIGLLVAVMTVPLVASALLAANATTGTLSGTLVDSAGKIVANQKVRIKKVLSRDPVGKSTGVQRLADSLTVATLTTDKDGKFTQAFDPGSYWAEAGSKTLGYAKERFEITAGQTTELKLSLTKDEVQK